MSALKEGPIQDPLVPQTNLIVYNQRKVNEQEEREVYGSSRLQACSGSSQEAEGELRISSRVTRGTVKNKGFAPLYLPRYLGSFDKSINILLNCILFILDIH